MQIGHCNHSALKKLSWIFFKVKAIALIYLEFWIFFRWLRMGFLQEENSGFCYVYGKKKKTEHPPTRFIFQSRSEYLVTWSHDS